MVYKNNSENGFRKKIKPVHNQSIDSFKKFVEDYNFNYKIESEAEFDRLKKKLLASSDFSKDSSINNDPIKNLLRKRRYNKLTKELEKYIKKKKNQYFYKDENKSWLINMILREYTRTAISNSMQVKTSLYIDSEYYNAIDTFNDIPSYNRILSLFLD